MTKFIDKKFIALLFLMMFLVVVAGWVVVNKSVNGVDTAHGKFLKELQGNVDEVETIILQKKHDTITIRKVGGQWVLTEKNNYPVDLEKIRQLVVNSEMLEILERKTDNPQRHVKLGLELNDDEDSPAVRIMFTDATENKIFADFVRGYRRGFGQAEGEDAVYIRNADENQTWLVKGDMAFKLDLNTLIHKSAFKIDADRIMRVSFYPPIGDDFEISRLPRKDFEITSPRHEAKSHSELNSLGAMLSDGLVFTDVLPESKIPFSRKLVTQIVYHTFDGLNITLKVLLLEENGVWLRISANATKKSKKNEAEMINSVAKDWVYGVSDTIAERLTVELDSLVKE